MSVLAVGFSFREIAFKSSSVHYHFPAKDDLAAAVVRRRAEYTSKHVDGELEKDPDPGKAAGQEYADVKPLCRGMLFGLVEPGLEVLQGLHALSNYSVIHASSPLWCDIPSKAMCFMIVDDADRLHPGVDDDVSNEVSEDLRQRRQNRRRRG